MLRKTADSEWEILGVIFVGDELKFIDDTIVQGVQYAYTIAVSAPLRDEILNDVGADFLWALPEVPETPVEPEEPTEPETPVEPEEPTEPETPVEPEEPTEPEDTIEPLVAE